MFYLSNETSDPLKEKKKTKNKTAFFSSIASFIKMILRQKAEMMILLYITNKADIGGHLIKKKCSQHVKCN